jgi:hypothetical protein
LQVAPTESAGHPNVLWGIRQLAAPKNTSPKTPSVIDASSCALKILNGAHAFRNREPLASKGQPAMKKMVFAIVVGFVIQLAGLF